MQNKYVLSMTGEQVEQALKNATIVPKTIDFSNFENGYFVEEFEGESIRHNVTFDEQGRPNSIDGVEIKWGDS